MTKRIFRSICVVALTVFLATLGLIMGVLYSYFTQVQQRQLRTEVALTAQAVAMEGLNYLENLSDTECRITWIDSDGTVLFDNRTASGGMENHLERDEVRKALALGYGESARYSDTLMARSLYAAQRLPDGTVIRLSSVQSSVLTLLLELSPSMGLVFAAALILSLVLAARLSKAVVKPLNELDLDTPLGNEGYAELSPLLRRIDAQQTQLRQQAAELSRKKSEFNTVTQNMSEGLLLLSGGGIILSMNPAAGLLLGLDQYAIGQDFLSVNQDTGINRLVSQALTGTRSETVVSLPSGQYEVDASPIRTEDAVSGVVLLLIDVTGRQRSEQMRREFTANVSHELKTPLHAISGYAELLKSGMVQPKDVTAFSEKIYTEAQRMIRLVEDIIRLSQLEEGPADMRWEMLDLMELAKEVVEDLSIRARKAEVSLSVTGGPACVTGSPQLLRGIITNLCDNAIKYNRPGGSVRVIIGADQHNTFLTVADTGIGIPPEHQERIFERFYRVDKSHSKSMGGTGLGLSITKHSVLLHRGKITLTSTPGTGTTVVITLPKKIQ